MTTSDIENYVRGLSEGLESQGEGRFTLNKIPRSTALVQLSETHPLRWVGLVLQSAVAGRAVAASVGSNASSVGAEYLLTEMADDFLNPDLLLGESDKSHPGLRFLAQALQWASAQSPAQINLICEGPHPGYHIEWEGDQSKRQSLPPCQGRSRVALLVNCGPGHPKRLWASASLERELLERFNYLPIPLTLDSRELKLGSLPLSPWMGCWLCPPNQERFLGVVAPLEITHSQVQVGRGPVKQWGLLPPPPTRHFAPDPLPSRQQQYLDNRMQSAHLWLGGDVASDQLRREELRTDWRSLVVKKTLKGEWTLPLSYVPKIPGTSRVSCRALSWRGNEQLLPVHFGMTLNALPLSGGTVVLPCQDLETDFSGLTAVQNQALKDLLAEAKAYLPPRSI